MHSAICAICPAGVCLSIARRCSIETIQRPPSAYRVIMEFNIFALEPCPKFCFFATACWPVASIVSLSDRCKFITLTARLRLQHVDLEVLSRGLSATADALSSPSDPVRLLETEQKLLFLLNTAGPCLRTSHLHSSFHLHPCRFSVYIVDNLHVMWGDYVLCVCCLLYAIQRRLHYWKTDTMSVTMFTTKDSSRYYKVSWKKLITDAQRSDWSQCSVELFSL